MQRKRLLLGSLWLITALILIALGGCTPSLTREQLTPSPTPPGTPRPTRTPDPRQEVDNLPAPDATEGQQSAATLLPAVSAIGPLLIEEFPLAREEAADLRPGSTEQNAQFVENLPNKIREGHEAIGADSPTPDLGAANTTLATSGYTLEAGGETLRLLQDGQSVEDCLSTNAFQQWQDGWVLELNGDVLLDGERLTEQRVFDEVFDWQPLAGKEFFLYRQNQTYGIYFDGRSLPQRYEEIVRWGCADQQGQDFNFSAKGSAEEAGFFARKGGRWYYVRVTVLE